MTEGPFVDARLQFKPISAAKNPPFSVRALKEAIAEAEVGFC